MEEERRKNDSIILITLEGIKRDTLHISKRLDKINGSIEDYQVTKERLDNACKAIEKISDKLELEIEPTLVNIKIKFYAITTLVGLVSGGIGSAIGAAIVRFTIGG